MFKDKVLVLLFNKAEFSKSKTDNSISRSKKTDTYLYFLLTPIRKANS